MIVCCLFPLILIAYAKASVIFRKLPAGNGFEFTNDLVRTTWTSNNNFFNKNSFNQTYEVQMDAGWLVLAGSESVEIQQKSFASNSKCTTRQRLSIAGLDHGLPAPIISSAVPTMATDFSVVGNGTSSAMLQYNLVLGSYWSVHVVLTLNAGVHHINERLEFMRTAGAAVSKSHLDNVRVGKLFRTSGIPKQLQLSFWRAVGYSGWAWPNASFVIQSLGTWSPQSGGGAFPDKTHWSGNKVHIGPEFTVAHQAPPARNDQSPRINWISIEDVGVGETYVLEHNCVMRPGYHFDREFLEYLWSLEPPQQLSPRFPYRRTVEKMLFALQYTPGPDGDVGGAFREYNINASGVVNGTGTKISIGFIAQAWYNFLGQINDPNGQGNRFTLLIQHSPDWGAGMDAWTCLFLCLYAQAYGDTPDRWASH